MCVSIPYDVLHRLAHALHVCVAVPEERWYVGLVAQMVFLDVVRHVQPIHPANELAPTQQLADKTFHAVERRLALVIRLDRFLYTDTRVQQLDVQRCRQPGMVEKRFVGPHRILIFAELGKRAFDEVPQHRDCLGMRDGQLEIVQLTGMVRKSLLDQFETLPR